MKRGDEERRGVRVDRGGCEGTALLKSGLGNVAVPSAHVCLFAALKNTESSEMADPTAGPAGGGAREPLSVGFSDPARPPVAPPTAAPPGALRGPSHQPASRPSVRPSVRQAARWPRLPERRVQQFSGTLGRRSHAQSGLWDTRRESGA